MTEAVLGRPASLPASPDEAVLDTVPNPHPSKIYAVRFTCPEFTSLCPITGQPDFAHIVIDYVPDASIVESKSLKLFLGSFRNHGAFHENCTLMIADRLVQAAAPRWLRVAGYWYPRGGIPIDVFYQTGEPPLACGFPTPASPLIAAGDEAGGMSAGIRDAIRAQALAIGFDAVGFARAEAAPEARENLHTFLASGHHGDMGWLADTAARRSDPQVLWPEARTVVVLGVNYGPDHDPLAITRQPEHGAISVYAQNRDYHNTIKKRLKSLARWITQRWPGDLKVFVDTAPVMEKPLAQQAGLGWQGKHTNLVSREFGSWLFLGEIYLSIELPPDAPERDHCGTCRNCLDVCPTDAFLGPHRLDARRCISYLTIEHKGPIPRDLRHLMGNRIYGCDDCLAVCPWNKFARTTAEPSFIARDELTAPRLTELAALDDAAFRALFSGSPVKRIGRNRFLRNVLMAIGNAPSGNPAMLAAVRRSLDDDAALVRAAAIWAFARLAAADQIADEFNHRAERETDPMVREEWASIAPVSALSGAGSQA